MEVKKKVIIFIGVTLGYGVEGVIFGVAYFWNFVIVIVILASSHHVSFIIVLYSMLQYSSHF